MGYKAILVGLFTASAYCASLDIFLAQDPNSCGGLGAICADVAYYTCCYKPDKLWGSAQANGGTKAAKLYMWGKGTDGLYCSSTREITPHPAVPVCLEGRVKNGVGGASVRNNPGTRRMEQPQEVAAVEADDAFVAADKTYIITKGKLAAMRTVLPIDNAAKIAFIKEHADIVKDTVAAPRSTANGDKA